MAKIARSLEGCLKQLNPNIILMYEGNQTKEKHRIKNWPRYLHPDDLKLDASIKSDIHREGKLKICVYGGKNKWYLYQK